MVPWHICKDIESIAVTWEIWLKLFLNVVDKHIPKCYPWITNEIIDIMKERDYVLLAAKRERSSVL